MLCQWNILKILAESVWGKDEIMTLLQLQYFQALAHELHYTRTAEELHISQPSLSYAINELEKELGVKLFQREGRKVILTVYGQQFLPYVEKAMSLVQEGTDTLRQMVTNAPQIVRLGYFHSISASFIPSLVDGFYRQEAGRKIQFHFIESPSYEVLSHIQARTLDLGFSVHRAEWAEAAGVIRQPLYLAVPAGHPLSKRDHVSFLDFAHEPQIVLEQSSNLRFNMDRVFSRHGVIPNIVFEVRECNAALQYVSLGFGVSVLPQVPAMDSGKVVILPISDQDREFVRTVYLTYHKSYPLSPAVQKVRDYIIENFALEM